ncbi:hypothetical protein LTR08_004938 [Meristemomyces frigidus]|nr:hypothetical protein LTR08_004938 [Meristemomyces frigidus]
MASILRQIIASPRLRHTEADLDLCYVTDNIIATSGPSSSYPQVAYRNPTKDLVKFLDAKHGNDWSIWEFRAEGTGYPDEEVYGRVRHYPWPDHHPPPFALVPLIMASMKQWLRGEDAEGKGRVVVVHCKAGKGRSGTMACSYLISEEGWSPADAVARFTERRMRPGFGPGISIPSQQRTIRYVDRWTRHGKAYVERPVEVAELHVWGLRDGVKIAVEGYVEEGKVIKNFHTFHSTEREIIRGSIRKENGLADVALEAIGKNKKRNTIVQKGPSTMDPTPIERAVNDVQSQLDGGISRTGSELAEGGDVVFRPSRPICLTSSDINIDFERRNKTKYGGFTMVTSVAHVWFNTFFEGNGPEQSGVADSSGVFEIEWEAMDGIKGSSRKGTRAFDKIAVVWKAVEEEDKKEGPNIVVNEPANPEPINLEPN